MRELRQLKDLRHENVNTFIGLFIDPNAPALIFEYGQRGSLEVTEIDANLARVRSSWDFFQGYSEKGRN